MDELFGNHYLQDVMLQFRGLKSLADRAVAQVSDVELFVTLDEESNSVAAIMKHISGNQRSRWTDFLTSDGEKPDRNRDTEFEVQSAETRDSVMRRWEQGWDCLFQALEPLRADDLRRTVTIRGQPYTVVQAIDRQLTHYGAHVGQIVFLAKHLRSREWKSLSIPRGKSAEVNAAMRSREKQ
ncbi:MAG TPA: DUF1572 family protein [Terriglobia bacterium]|nr:DUF1572 family protein [Terriglobia bacterium]